MIFGNSCKEVYNPEVDLTKAALVVEGLITDEPGPYTVKLTKAIPYNLNALLPETGAQVFVEDEDGTRYAFKETSPGNYTSDPNKFKTVVGKAYTLVVKTVTNKAYRSSPQILYPKGRLDTIYPIIKTSPLRTYIGGELVIQNTKGVEFMGSIVMQNDSSPYYRFSNTLLLEYTSKFAKDTSKTPNYCWMKYTPYDYLNLSERMTQATRVPQSLGFCPLDSGYYGIIQEVSIVYHGGTPDTIVVKKKLHVNIISFKQYHLNPDIYQYYKSVNDQLSARQQILDPVTFQSIGNITCITNPDESALGIFEASSVSMYTYYYLPDLSGTSITFKKMNPLDIEKLSEPDCKTTPPDFWLNLK